MGSVRGDVLEKHVWEVQNVYGKIWRYVPFIHEPTPIFCPNCYVLYLALTVRATKHNTISTNIFLLTYYRVLV